ncbi:glycosyltransferase [Lyngbya confervoides]|uniref:Glycosyltransferase n=1 Tax=Lyngbya confervoides BDU141951 TaxID=1574623 RepID=A0ABD4T8F0_9CYAN|nr:glycosyltransferase [Lyngbya confervoides]MCM1984901.1 glycosyltransferase [Lyngbya confervoides BDU141951]
MNCIQKQHLSNHHLMLFDLSIYGHHPSYIQYLIECWEDYAIPGKLSIVVSPQFLMKHYDVVEYANRPTVQNVEFVAITYSEEAVLANRSNGFNRNWRNFQEWKLFRKYARTLKVDHALVMYLDTYELPIALDVTLPCDISGIYFRPTFHYPQLSGKQSSRREQIQHMWERMLLHRVLHNRKFRNLFSLDPFVLKYIDNVPAWASVLHLSDPVRLDPAPADLEDRLSQLTQHLGIEAGRTIFLMFGALTGRKGIYQILDSIPLLPKDVNRKICLLLVGGADDGNRVRINHQVDSLCERYPIQIIRHYDFVPDAEVPLYFYLSDIVLAIYQRHVGMSGILIWAATTGKPVISSDYGLMGAIVRQYQLGTTLDSSEPKQLAQGMQTLIDNPSSAICLGMAKSFASQNSHRDFSKLIFQCLGNSA